MKQQELVKPPLMSSSNTRFVEDPFSHVKEAAEETQSKEMELLKLLTKESNQAKYNARVGGQAPAINRTQKSDRVDLDGITYSSNSFFLFFLSLFILFSIILIIIIDLLGGEKKDAPSATSINGFELIQHDEIAHLTSDRPPLLLDASLGLGRQGGAKSNFKIPETPDRYFLFCM